MKKLLLLPLVLFSLFCQAQPFTAGNLAVYRIGNGTDSLSSAPFAVNIEEYTKNGVFVISHPLPTQASGNNRSIVSSGTATSEGQMTLSANKRFLVVSGYDTLPAPSRLSINTSTAIAVNRVIGLLAADGTLDATTALTDAYSSNNFRGAASDDGINIWTAGTASASASAGIRYTTKGATTSTQLSTSVTNTRTVNIFNGQLYCSSGSGAFKAISQVGTGLPSTTGQTITVLPGFPNVSGLPNDPYAFSINPSGTIAYLADNRSKIAGGGIQKWQFDGTNWNLQYTLDSGLSAGLRNLTVDWNNNPPVIFATTGDPIVKDQPGNKIVRVTDEDSASIFSVLATAAPNTVFRGIAFTPTASASTTYTFTGNGNWNIAANWSNTTIPPTPLPQGAGIVIDHAVGGNCILNINQRLSPGSNLTVRTGKNLLITGNLTLQN